MQNINVSALVFNSRDTSVKDRQIMQSIRKELGASPYTDNPQMNHVWLGISGSPMWELITFRSVFMERIIAPAALRYRDIY